MISFEEAEIRSNIIKAFAHPVRLMIVDFLQSGQKPFSAVNDNFLLDKSTISKHLTVLKEAGIVSSHREKHETIYTLEIPCLNDFFGCITGVIENNVRRQQVCLHKQ